MDIPEIMRKIAEQLKSPGFEADMTAQKFQGEKDTPRAMKEWGPDIGSTDWERIRETFSRILISPEPAAGLMMLQETGVLHVILPEIQPAIGFPQSPPHPHDVFGHILATCERVPAVLNLRLAALLHDIGKPATVTVEEGAYRFFGHHTAGVEIAGEVLRRFHYPADLIENVQRLIAYHMFTYTPKTTDEALKQLVREVGLENMKDLIALRKADQGAIFPDASLDIYEQMYRRIMALAEEGQIP